MIHMGDTRVLCAASVEEGVPGFLRGQSRGWVTAEYGMLPRSTLTRRQREVGRRAGRSLEIQRLIGRSLRAVIDMDALGERTITVDCDVIQADGGTRTAAITGAYVALHQAVSGLLKKGIIKVMPLKTSVAAVSVGLVLGDALLDVWYEEDLHADVDFNVVMTGDGRFIEVQGTAEGEPFSRDQLESLLELAAEGVNSLGKLQQSVLRE